MSAHIMTPRARGRGPEGGGRAGGRKAGSAKGLTHAGQGMSRAWEG
jgi:hypothetical protein